MIAQDILRGALSLGLVHGDEEKRGTEQDETKRIAAVPVLRTIWPPDASLALPSRPRVAETTPTALLRIEHARKQFGGVVAVNDVSFEVKSREIVALIGPNGAGKSTLFRLILGEHHPGSGDIFFVGENITALKSLLRIARRP